MELPSGLQYLHVPSALRCWLWIYKWKLWNIVTCGFYLGKTGHVSKWVRQAKSWIWEGFIKQYLCMFYIAFTISSINFHIHINWTCHLRSDGRTSNSNNWGESTLFTQLRGLDFTERYLGIGLWFLASNRLVQGLPKVKPWFVWCRASGITIDKSLSYRQEVLHRHHDFNIGNLNMLFVCSLSFHVDQTSVVSGEGQQVVTWQSQFDGERSELGEF